MTLAAALAAFSGCDDGHVSLNTAPRVSIRVSQSAGIGPLEVSFFSSVSGGDGDLSYRWDFGDGSDSSEPNPTHEFSANGEPYSVELTVTDADGDRGSSLLKIAVGTDEAPTAAASATPVSGAAPLTVSFDCTVGGGNEPLEARWSVGEGDVTRFAKANHTYTSPGDYDARCTVVDADGDVATDLVTVSVAAPNAADAGPTPDASTGSDGGLECGPGTFEHEGECVAVDPDDTTAPTTTADPPGGEVPEIPLFVELTADEPATVFFTTDGSQPNTSSSSQPSPATVTGAQEGVPVRFFSVDPAGNQETEKSVTYTVDSLPPGAVTNFAANFTGTDVELTWTNPGDADLAGVLIVRRPIDVSSGLPEPGVFYAVSQHIPDGSEVISTGLTESFTDANVPPGNWQYRAFAFDDAANYSGPSESQRISRDLTASQLGTISVALSPSVEANVTTQPEFVDLAADASYDATNDELTLTVELDSAIGRPVFNPKLVIRSLGDGSLSGDGDLGGDPFIYYGPDSLAPDQIPTRTFVLSGVDGSVDPVAVDVEVLGHPMLYVGQKQSVDNLIHLVDTGANRYVGTRPCDSATFAGRGCAPRGAVLSNDAAHLYAGHRNLPVVREINTITHTTDREIELATDPAGARARVEWIDIDRQGGHLYALLQVGAHQIVAGQSGRLELVRLNPVTLVETGRVTIRTDIAEERGRQFDISDDGTRAAIPVDLVGVHLVDLTTMTLIDADDTTAGAQAISATDLAAVDPADVVFSPDGGTLYVTYGKHADQALLDEIDLSDFSITPVSLSPPDTTSGQLLFGPEGRLWYALGLADGGFGVTVIDVQNGNAETALSTIPNQDTTSGRWGMGLALSGDGARMYTIATVTPSSVAVFDVASLTRIDVDGDTSDGVVGNIDLTFGNVAIRTHTLVVTPF